MSRRTGNLVDRKVIEDWAARVKARRLAFELRQSVLGGLAGLPQPTISDVERAVGTVTDDTKWRLAGALRCTVDELFPWPDYAPKIKRTKAAK